MSQAPAFVAFGCGKVILFGEHAVVHGRPALAAGIDRGVKATAARHTRDLLCIDPWGVEVAPAGETGSSTNTRDGDQQTDLEQAFHVALSESQLSEPLNSGQENRVRVQAQVQIPTAAGLGASAALGVAVIGALHEFRGLAVSPQHLADKALAWEQVFHGNASGVDNHMAAHGGVTRFQKGQASRNLELRQALSVIVANSAEEGSTKTMVGSVARQLEQNPEKVNKIFDGIASIVEQGIRCLREADWNSLGQLMTLNQTLLSGLMVSTSRLEELCRVATGAGAWGAKLTGAGGGGCIIALAPPRTEDQVVAALGRAGAKPFLVQIGGAPQSG